MPVSLSTSIPQPTQDGVYPYAIPTQGAQPPAQNTSLIGRTGFANWGPIGIPQLYNTLAQAIYLWGPSANIILTKAADPCNGNNGSLVAATQYALPEGSYFADVRVTDGTDAAATGTIADGSSGIVANLGATYHGTDGNTITAQVSVYQGQFAAGGTVIPMAQLTVKITGRPTWTSVPFVMGTASAGYVKATFLANLQTALLGTYGNGGTACPYAVYLSSGSSVIAPALTANTFSGGLSGYNGAGGAGFTTAISPILIGAPSVGANTGIYCFQGVGINLLHCVGLTDLAQASVLASFGQSNTCTAFIADKFGTSTANVITDKVTNNASSPWLVVCNDFTYAQDVVDSTGPAYIDPAVKVAAFYSQLNVWQYGSNKPYYGGQNMIGTYRTQTGIPYSQAELGQLAQAGVVVITNPVSRGKVFGLSNGLTSDGVTPVSDTRMLNYIANAITGILGQFVGESQTPPPPVGTPDTDATRTNARHAVAAFLATLLNPNNPQIAAASQIMDGTNNTALTVSQGYLYDKIMVTTLAGIRFILAGLQVGQTVSINSIP